MNRLIIDPKQTCMFNIEIRFCKYGSSTHKHYAHRCMNLTKIALQEEPQIPEQKANLEEWEHNHQINSRIHPHQNHQQIFHPLQQYYNYNLQHLSITKQE